MCDSGGREPGYEPGRGRGRCRLSRPEGQAGVLVGLEYEFSACKMNVGWRDRLGPNLGMPEIADSGFLFLYVSQGTIEAFLGGKRCIPNLGFFREISVGWVLVEYTVKNRILGL